PEVVAEIAMRREAQHQAERISRYRILGEGDDRQALEAVDAGAVQDGERDDARQIRCGPAAAVGPRARRVVSQIRRQQDVAIEKVAIAATGKAKGEAAAG